MRWSWLAGVCLAFAAHAHALVIGVYELSPHMVVDTQKEPRGAVVDFVQEVLVKSGEFPVVEWRVANFARMLRELDTGQIDMVFMVARNEQRQKLFRYSSQPFFDTRSAVVVLSIGAAPRQPMLIAFARASVWCPASPLVEPETPSC